MPSNSENKRDAVIVIGGGPAGLMAADVISAAGINVALYDAMPSVGRKFLLAGIGGLNLTHSEPREQFNARYGDGANAIVPLLDEFGADAVRAWAYELGVETFIGSSGRVFPRGMKAAPLLRSWLRRLRANRVQLHARQRWCGWRDDGALHFQTADGDHFVQASAVVFALGGGSWARLGSDAAWIPLLQQREIPVTALRAANCGFNIEWSEFFKQRFAGQPLKSIAISCSDNNEKIIRQRGECVVTLHGIEGSLIYALSAQLRDRIAAEGSATIYIDLAPDRSLEKLTEALARPRGSRSISKHLHSAAGIDGVKTSLLHEILQPAEFNDTGLLAATIKALPLQLLSPRPIDEAISTAGGVSFDGVDSQLMLRALPGYFCAGEMLDWEAPTGGYLLTACLASGRRAGHGVINYFKK
ncbi:MAG: NAD(FAD)-utilizing dehydrogenase [Verrucomicrobiaceae bacterium]|nr:NAD(FAD)-utilizing dehydrogenase [Verrucomicrobiaceae bacterium]